MILDIVDLQKNGSEHRYYIYHHVLHLMAEQKLASVQPRLLCYRVLLQYLG